MWRRCSVLLSPPREGWGQGHSATVLQESLAAIMADAGAQTLLDTTLVPRILAMTMNIRDECMTAVQAPAPALSDSLMAIANDIATIKDEVAKLAVSNGQQRISSRPIARVFGIGPIK